MSAAGIPAAVFLALARGGACSDMGSSPSGCMPISTVSTELITEASELSRLRQEWTRLVNGRGDLSVFTTWEWIYTWWTSYAADCRLSILTVFDGDRMVGIVPLYRAPLRAYLGIDYEALRLIGDGSHDSDYLDLIAERGQEERVVEAVVEQFVSGSLRADLMLISELPSSSPSLPLLRRVAAARGCIVRSEKEVPCAYVDLPREWDRYIQGLNSRMRTKVRSLTKRFDADPRAVFDMCGDSKNLEERLDSLFELHARRWQGKGQAGVFTSVTKREFYKRMAESFLHQGWLRFYSLQLDGRYVAHQFCSELNGTVYLHQEGFDPELSDQGIGNVLRAYVFRDCIRRGVRVYDFLGGVTSHKLDWGSSVKTSLCLCVAARALKNLPYLLIPCMIDWARKVKNFAEHPSLGPILRKA